MPRKEVADYIEFSPTILIDSNEQMPYDFKGLRCPKTGRRIETQTERRSLWNYETPFGRGLADYTLLGHELSVGVERKSLSDLYSTMGQRRDRFEAEIERLHKTCLYSAVVVEATISQISQWDSFGPHPNSVLGSIRAWAQRYPRCGWKLVPGRTAAEMETFLILQRYYSDYERGKLCPLPHDRDRLEENEQADQRRDSPSD